MAVSSEKKSAQSVAAAVVSSSLAFMGFAGGAVIVHLYAIDKTHPVFFAILRVTFSIPLFWLASVIADRGLPRRPQCLCELLFIFIFGVFWIVLQISVTVAIFLTNSLAASIVELSFPVVVSIASVLTRTETKPDFSTVYGWVRTLILIPTVGGAVTMVVLGSENKQSAPKHCGLSEGATSKQADWTLGSVFLLLFMTSFASSIITQRRLFTKYKYWKRHSLTAVAWATTLAYPLLWLIYPAAKAIVKAKTSCGEMIDPWLIKGTAVYALEWHIFINSASCNLWLVYASACAPPSVVSFFAPMGPITAVILSQLLLDYSITFGEGVCMGVVLLCFFAFIWAKQQEDNVQRERETRHLSVRSTIELQREKNMKPWYYTSSV